MELAQVLIVLWNRRSIVALGSLVAIFVALSTGYHVSVLPPNLKAKSLAMGTADTVLLVDTPVSAVLNVNADVGPLVARASVLAPLMTSLPVRQAIATAAGVPVSAIYTAAPLNGDGTIFATEPSAAQRSQQLLGENLGLRLSISANAGTPTIAISAQATSAQAAIRLANAAATGFINYMKTSEAAENIPVRDRTVLRQLGEAEGGTIGSGTNIGLVVLAFFGVMIVWMVLVVVGSSVAENLRVIRASGERPEESPELG
jgi:capsular polysaccharide biosynthesis protein